MKYEYNQDLSFVERTELVSKEIIGLYPEVPNDTAYFVAANSKAVDDHLTPDDKFDRYYFLLRVLDRNNPEYVRIFNDAFDVYEEGLNENNSRIMGEIIKYCTGEIDIFPEIA